MILGLVPARGGSKGIPGKNLRELAGKPLVVRAVECAKQCPSIEQVVVSTDSQEIAAVAQKAGAEFLGLRPSELATDHAAMLPVMQHAIKTAEAHFNERVEVLVLVDPTAPLRKVEDVENGIALLKKSGCDAVVSGHAAHRNPYFNMVKLIDDYVQLVLQADPPIVRRQDAPPVYDLNTVVWVYKRAALMDEQERLPSKTKLLIIPAERAVDIDTDLDLHRLQYLV